MPYRVMLTIEECDANGQWIEDVDLQPEQVGEFDNLEEANKVLTKMSIQGDKYFEKRAKAFERKEALRHKHQYRRIGPGEPK